MNNNSPSLILEWLQDLRSAAWIQREKAIESLIQIEHQQVLDQLLQLQESQSLLCLESLLQVLPRWPFFTQTEFLIFAWDHAQSLRSAIQERANRLPPRHSLTFALHLLDENRGESEWVLAIELIQATGSHLLDAAVYRLIRKVHFRENSSIPILHRFLRSRPQPRFLRYLLDQLHLEKETKHLEEILLTFAAWAPRLKLPWKVFVPLIFNPPHQLSPEIPLKVLEAAGRPKVLHPLIAILKQAEHPLFATLCRILAQKADRWIAKHLILGLKSSYHDQQIRVLSEAVERIPIHLKAKFLRKALAKAEARQLPAFIRLLGECQQNQDILLFQKLALDPRAQVCHEAIYALVRYHFDDQDAFLLTLLDRDESTASSVVWALTAYPSPARHLVYLELLQREYPAYQGLRPVVMQTLGRILERESLDPQLLYVVMQNLNHENSIIRFSAAQVLGLSRFPAALKVLFEQFEREKDSQTHGEIVHSIQKLIGHQMSTLDQWLGNKLPRLPFAMELLFSSDAFFQLQKSLFQTWYLRFKNEVDFYLAIDQQLHLKRGGLLLMSFILELDDEDLIEMEQRILHWLSILAELDSHQELMSSLILRYPRLTAKVQFALSPFLSKAYSHVAEIASFWQNQVEGEHKIALQKVLLNLAGAKHG